jgi:predicted nucleic acid-binding protein
VTAETVVIDTDVASKLMRRTLPGSVVERLTGATLAVTFVTVGELFRGATHARWGTRRTSELSGWLARVLTIPADQAVARRWGEITGAALRVGRPLPANDAWIAACCLTHAAPLATLNTRDFVNVKGLRLLTAVASS